jgi:hypothetical protein
MPNPRRSWPLAALSLATLSLGGCESQSPVAYDSAELESVASAAAEEAPVQDTSATDTSATDTSATESSTGTSGVELLDDPLLGLVLQSLSDRSGARAITVAIDSWKRALVGEDPANAKVQLDLAYVALDEYPREERADPTDLVYLDVIGGFLDGVARMPR